MNNFKNILIMIMIIMTIFISFILGSIATMKDYQGATKEERYLYSVKSVCEYHRSKLLSYSQEYFVEKFNPKTNSETFKITIICEIKK